MPHTSPAPGHVPALADQAATAVHDLVHLTRPAITALEVSDLRLLTAALAELTAALPQLLTQLNSYLPADAPLAAPNRQLPDDPHTPGNHARSCLRRARTAAAHLATALEAAHQTLGDLAETPQPRGSIFNRR
jgi:hypothetical protein